MGQQDGVVNVDNVFLLKPFSQVKIARDLAHTSNKAKPIFALGEMFLMKKIDNESNNHSKKEQSLNFTKNQQDQ